MHEDLKKKKLLCKKTFPQKNWVVVGGRPDNKNNENLISNS